MILLILQTQEENHTRQEVVSTDSRRVWFYVLLNVFNNLSASIRLLTQSFEVCRIVQIYWHRSNRYRDKDQRYGIDRLYRY